MKRLIVIIILLAGALLYSQENEQPEAEDTALPGGYGGASWGESVSAVREKIKGRLTYTDEKTVIFSREGDLEYHYGFFYIDPAAFPPDQPQPVNGGVEPDGAIADTDITDEGVLFFVALKFPYLSSDLVRKKIVDTYGEPTAENIRNNQGALAWESRDTIIIMWIDNYENKPFSRRITYISRDLSEKLNAHQKKVLNKAEIDILNILNP